RPLRAFRSSWAAALDTDSSVCFHSGPLSGRISVTKVRVVRRRLDDRHSLMWLRPVLPNRLDVFGDYTCGPGNTQLREEKLELRVIRGSELRLGLLIEVPETLLERPNRLFSRLVEELFVGVSRLALVLGVHKKPRINLGPEALGNSVV